MIKMIMIMTMIIVMETSPSSLINICDIAKITLKQNTLDMGERQVKRREKRR